jgi:hypothetical protein
MSEHMGAIAHKGFIPSNRCLAHQHNHMQETVRPKKFGTSPDCGRKEKPPIVRPEQPAQVEMMLFAASSRGKGCAALRGRFFIRYFYPVLVIV